jgi:hypothetical protein
LVLPPHPLVASNYNLSRIGVCEFLTHKCDKKAVILQKKALKEIKTNHILSINLIKDLLLYYFQLFNNSF